MADAPVIEKASDWINLSDDALATMIGHPEAASALQEADKAAAEGTEAAPEAKPEVKPVEQKAPETPVELEAKVTPKAPETVSPEKPAYVPITKFKLKDSQGELDEADASQNLRFDFKANGKDYEAVPLDKVVKWAQMGLYNEDREAQVQAARQFVTEAQTALGEKDSQLADFDQYTKRLLTDPNFLREAQQIFVQQSSPEARAARAEQELEQFRAQSATASEDQQISGFVTNALMPTVVKLTQENPDVRSEEIIGRFTMLTAPLLVRGRIPTHALPDVQRLVQNELSPWVEEQQAGRVRTKTVQTKQVEEAQTKVALAKRAIARRTAPPPASAPAQPKAKKYATSKAWLDDLLPIASNDD